MDESFGQSITIKPVRGGQIDVQKSDCHQPQNNGCHGQDGSAEGGMNFILDPAKLVARKKIVPGQPDQSLLFKRLSTGKMPPAGETPRPSEADIAVVKQWIEVGAPPPTLIARRPILTEAEAFKHILADLDRQDRPARRFLRLSAWAWRSNLRLCRRAGRGFHDQDISN